MIERGCNAANFDVTELTAYQRVTSRIKFMPRSPIPQVRTWLDALENVPAAHFVVDKFALDRNSYLADTISGLQNAIAKTTLLTVGGAERIKSMAALKRLIGWFDDVSVGRRAEPIIAVGGGALLDAVGFAASVYRRGVTLYRVPTTLTGIVDAAVGGKTGINYFGRKNLVGSFYPAAVVVLEPRFLTTLTNRHLSSGAAEVLKVALAEDADLFALLLNNLKDQIQLKFQTDIGYRIISSAIRLLTERVWEDLWEDGLNRHMDLGHSLSKVFEEDLTPRPTHGEAVSMDLALTSALSLSRGYLTHRNLEAILTILSESALPVDDVRIDAALLERGLRDTMVHRDGGRLFPVVGPIGSIQFASVSLDSLLAAQNDLRLALEVP